MRSEDDPGPINVQNKHHEYEYIIATLTQKCQTVDVS